MRERENWYNETERQGEIDGESVTRTVSAKRKGNSFSITTKTYIKYKDLDFGRVPFH